MIIKLCGFTREEDVRKACEIGADMIGVVIVEDSKRFVSAERARELFSVCSCKKVVVCMPENAGEMIKLNELVEPDYIQVHSSVHLDEMMKARDEGCRLIGVVKIPERCKSPDPVISNARKLEECVDLLLCDTLGKGGTGKTHDWRVSAMVRRSVRKPFILSGGLTPENVAEAIRAVNPDGVDASSGIEISPGVKDEGLMRRFVNACRNEGKVR